MLVYFYKPSCAVCKAFYVEFLFAAARLKFVYNNDAVLARVDAESTAGGQALAARFNVTDFPTLIWFVNGNLLPYTGTTQWLSMDQDDIVFWVESQTDVITTALTEQVLPH